MLLSALNDAGNIVATILVLLIMLGLSYLLFRSIRRDQKINKEINDPEQVGVITKGELVKAMSEFVARFKNSSEFSLLYFELENFNSLKTSFGLKQSNKFKREVITNVLSVLPRGSLLAHYSDNEYMVLLRGRISQSRLEGYAQSILDSASKPIRIDDDEKGEITFNINMGIVIYPLNGRSEKELFNNAEMALYASKKDGSRQFTIFSDELGKNELSNLAYYREIKEAIRKKEFSFVYHPIIDTKNKKIIQIEAFIRWKHPTLGVLPPNKFLTIMEHSGDINWIGRWGIEELSRQLHVWQKDGLNFKLSFNLSPKQLLDPKIAEDFMAIVKSFHVQPKMICLEIVEFAMFEKYGIINENINKLAKLGFSICIDDFGVEANTLARISKLPIKAVKLDKKFVEDSKDNFVVGKIVEMLVEIGKNEQIDIIAEGIENKDSLEHVEKFDIYQVQGFYFCQPLDSQEMSEYIKEEKFVELLKN